MINTDLPPQSNFIYTDTVKWKEIIFVLWSERVRILCSCLFLTITYLRNVLSYRFVYYASGQTDSISQPLSPLFAVIRNRPLKKSILLWYSAHLDFGHGGYVIIFMDISKTIVPKPRRRLHCMFISSLAIKRFLNVRGPISDFNYVAFGSYFASFCSGISVMNSRNHSKCALRFTERLAGKKVSTDIPLWCWTAYGAFACLSPNVSLSSSFAGKEALPTWTVFSIRSNVNLWSTSP